MVGQNRKTDEEHDKDCVEKVFQLDGVKMTKTVREAGRFYLWGIVVSIF